MDSLEGRTLAGTYRIDAALGSGGMGVVYAATHARTGRRYAVKILRPEIAARHDALARFRREAEAVGSLGHPNVVAIHDFAESDGLAYLVMDLLQGEDLATRMDRGRLPLAEAVGLFEQIASGLAAAHARGIVHRDLKPANVLLARQPAPPGFGLEAQRAVLLDFGLAKSLAPVMGTPQYMSPEQASGEAVDARADLYALATMLYEMLAGQPPFSAPTLPALFAKLVSDPSPPLSAHRPDLPSALSDVLSRALAKSPRERYPDAVTLVRAVRVAIGSEGVPRTQAHARTPAPSPGAPHTTFPWGWLAAALALVIASAAGAAIAIGAWRASRPVEPLHARRTIEIAADEVRAAVDDERRTPRVIEEATLDEAASEEAAVDETEATVAPAQVVPPAPARPVRVPRSDAPAPPSAVAAPAGAASASPAGPPPGTGPPAGVQDAVAHMQRSDWRGCIRAARAAPRSPEILGARMSCALQAQDDAELRATCAEMRAHYPSHPQTRGCESILRGRGGTP